MQIVVKIIKKNGEKMFKKIKNYFFLQQLDTLVKMLKKNFFVF